MQSRTERPFRTHDGLTLDVTVYGNDDATLTVLLAHCWTLNQEDWHYQVRDLLQAFGHGIRIITWDHRGHGRSEGCSRGDCTIEHLARDMGGLIDELAPVGPLVLAGHSIGGMTLMALAEQRPEIFTRVVGAALVATSSGGLGQVDLGLPGGEAVRAQIPRLLALRSMTLSRRARRRAPIAETLVMTRLLFGSPQRLADTALAVEGLIRCPAATLSGYYEDCIRHERTEALKELDGIPTHIAVGTRDRLTPPSHARRMARALPSAALTVVPDAGHMLPLERDELVSGLLIRLVRPHLPRASSVPSA